MGRGNPMGLCLICQDQSYGRHYGVIVCDGCAVIFSVRKNITYTCISGDNKCIIDKTRRNWCPSCRLRKCYACNMDPEKVQKERGPRKKKANIEGEGSEINCPNKALDDILIKSVEISSKSGVLTFCNSLTKATILAESWPLFLILQTYASKNNMKLLFKLVRSLRLPLLETNAIELDKVEHSILINLLFCKLSSKIGRLNFAAAMTPVFCIYLFQYCTILHPKEPERLIKLTSIVEKLVNLLGNEEMKNELAKYYQVLPEFIILHYTK
uniref:Nuclear receptor domain-containing protein n=1 Tax=Rhabditophanes sp. KR3021 TaxID=114890 RepID=A0AC35TU13_9BILA